VINRAAVRAFGWSEPEEAVGKRLQTVIEPLILVVEPRWLRIINLRIDNSDLDAVMGHVRAIQYE